MEFAINEDGERCSIFKADNKQVYRCPCCNGELLQKRGKIVIWHFAHRSLKNCVGYYDNKGPWHRAMQELFPEKNREIFNCEFGKHFFDVLTDNGTIIEFQSSPLSTEEFQNRTDAYFSFSNVRSKHRPVWVFNYASRNFYVYFKSETDQFRKVRWYRPSKIFGNYSNKLSKYELWFRIAPLKYKPEKQFDTFYDGKEVQILDYSGDRHDIGYLKIINIYDGKIVLGTAYTEGQFKQYIQGL